jgi:hypothetical protein
MKKAAVSFVLLCLFSSFSYADSGDPGLEERIKALEAKVGQNASLEQKVSSLQTENELLKQRLASLEAASGVKPSGEEKPKPEAVTLDKIGTKLKIKGRWGAGYFKSGQGGAYPQGSFEVPEAKVQLGFEPDQYNTVIMRMNLNNAAFVNLDYFYVDSKNFLPQLEETPFTLESRIGRFKLPFGEETFSNNIVESALVSNSAANVAGSDEGVQLSGKIFKNNPLNLKWYFDVANGNSGTGSDNITPKSYTGKLSMTPIAPLYLSASVYNSGSLKTAASEMSLAGITARPTGATQWDRTMWELDARWDFEKGKVLDPPAYTDSKAYVRGAFGQLYDDAAAAGVNLDREANYGFVEGLYNFTPKYYAAYRYSIVDFRHGFTDSLNSISASSQYDRHTIAAGYRWTDKTIIKIAYDFNDADTAIGDPSDDLFTAALVSNF